MQVTKFICSPPEKQKNIPPKEATGMRLFQPGSLLLAGMHAKVQSGIWAETTRLQSAQLDRAVTIDIYRFPGQVPAAETSLLLINDGQDLVTMNFEAILNGLWSQERLQPLLCVGIHCGEDRKNEYGMRRAPDHLGRGAKATAYSNFLFEELMPYLEANYQVSSFREKAFAGFSLGGLSALDLVWNNPTVFSKAGVFSGSLWWRSKDKNEKDFNEQLHRMMHVQLREGPYKPGLRFFFEVGELDEKEDRNNNGVIDAIDDTIDLLRELQRLGYQEGPDYSYLQLADGKHDVPTWAKAFPYFLLWGWGK